MRVFTGAKEAHTNKYKQTSPMDSHTNDGDEKQFISKGCGNILPRGNPRELNQQPFVG
jgi:hypothetical protein